MNFHSSRKLIFASAFAAALCASTVRAVTTYVQLAYTPVTTQPSSNGDVELATWAAATITDYNANHNAGPDLPALPALSFKVDQNGPGPAGFTFGTGVSNISLNLTGNTYIIVSWGGSLIDNGTANNLYYIPATDTYDFTAAPNASGGLSSLHIYGGDTPGPGVPDGGASIALLAIGLLGLEGARRKLKL
jgi:hypothetical protein